MKVSNSTQLHTTRTVHTPHTYCFSSRTIHTQSQLTPSRPHPQASRPQLTNHTVTHRNSLHASHLTVLDFTHNPQSSMQPAIIADTNRICCPRLDLLLPDLLLLCSMPLASPGSSNSKLHSLELGNPNFLLKF